MAHYSIVHLNDEASEAFLHSRGFALFASCSNLSNWRCCNIDLFLPANTIIVSDIDIYAKISADYYKIGIEAGKRKAVNAITSSLLTIVDPQEPTTQEY